MSKKEKRNHPEHVRLTEDETIAILVAQLREKGYTDFKTCTGHQRGTDIVATGLSKKLHIEVKGAKGNPKSHVSTRTHFDSGQIKTHFGKAIVKAMELQLTHPDDTVAIAHPDDPYLRKVIGALVPRLEELGIEHYWVK